ncbi:MAG: hypothetical protein GX434_12165 [Peptococcaceae bacterium]|nr:hypothetical protein [Peptococcaceae bacterium]
MHKKTQRITVIVIIALVCISLIGSSFVAIFQPGTETATSENQAVLQKEYADRKAKVEALTKALEGAPQDLQIRQALGDAYYDKSRITGQLNMNEYNEDLQKAIENYKSVLAAKEDNDVMYKLATSAFLIGDKELAEKTYTDLLNKKADHVDALYGYGMFLFYEKGDYKLAKEKWQKALPLTADESMKKRLQEMISRADGMDISASDAKGNK